MAWIANWLNEAQQQEEALLTIDDTLLNLQTRSGLLDQIAPLKTYDDRDFLTYVVEKIRPIASVISWGAEVPRTQAGKFIKLTGELFKSGLGFEYDEEKQWAMKKAMEVATLRGLAQGVQDQMMADGTVIKGANNTLADYLFGTLADLAGSQVTLLDVLTWQALQFGEVQYDDPRTNGKIVVDYKDPDATYNHFPDALTGAEAWTSYATANGLEDLERDIETYIDTNGYRPAGIVMSRKLRRHLINQESTKRAVSSISNSVANVVINSIGTVSPEMLAHLLANRDLPPIIIFDEMYDLELVSKTYTKARFLNQNRYCFFNQGMGERAMGPTLEGDGAAGVFVQTREVTKMPPRDASESVATMLPVFAQPKQLFSRQAA